MTSTPDRFSSHRVHDYVRVLGVVIYSGIGIWNLIYGDRVIAIHALTIAVLLFTHILKNQRIHDLETALKETTR